MPFSNRTVDILYYLSTIHFILSIPQNTPDIVHYDEIAQFAQPMQIKNAQKNI